MTEDFPGTYVTNAASTSYAEYTKYGVQEESGGALKNGELVYYLADSFEDPTTSSTDGGDATLRVIDVAFQGLPNDDTVSDFPRWEDSDRAGTCTAGGSFYLEDNSQTWWCSASASHTHSGTGGAGSNASTLIDTTKSSNGYWQQANRFVGMILEVELDPVGAAGVYARSPITAYNSATQTASVSPAFSSTTFGKSYRIREPGADPVSGGIILNLWAQRRLKVTRRSDSSVHYCNITYSDDTRVYFTSGALGYTPLAGDAYEIIQIDPGLVVKYDPSSSDPLKTQSGWTGPYAKGTKPTICTAYGKYRKRDYVGLHFWDEAYKAIDALRWIKAGFTWSSRADAAVAELNERIETDGQTATGLDTWDHAKTRRRPAGRTRARSPAMRTTAPRPSRTPPAVRASRASTPARASRVRLRRGLGQHHGAQQPLRFLRARDQGDDAGERGLRCQQRHGRGKQVAALLLQRRSPTRPRVARRRRWATRRCRSPTGAMRPAARLMMMSGRATWSTARP
jgi:hypothetical protein